jgi:predicted SprT family Zn-dependent metalloprotease
MEKGVFKVLTDAVSGVKEVGIYPTMDDAVADFKEHVACYISFVEFGSYKKPELILRRRLVACGAPTYRPKSTFDINPKYAAKYADELVTATGSTDLSEYVVNYNNRYF